MTIKNEVKDVVERLDVLDKYAGQKNPLRELIRRAYLAGAADGGLLSDDTAEETMEQLWRDFVNAA